MIILLQANRLTILRRRPNGLRYWQVGVDNAWEQEKPEASLSWPAGQGSVIPEAREY